MKLLLTGCLLSIFAFFAIAMENEPWVVRLVAGTDVQQFAQKHGLRHVGPFKPLIRENYHVFEQLNPHSREVARTIDSDNRAEWAERQVKRKQYTRRINDPLYSKQWHLHGYETTSLKADKDTHTGRGVTIGIVDDGLQTGHAEIQANWDRSNSWDFNDNDADPNPRAGSGHGTAAAGVAAAVGENGHCGMGVAQNAHIAGLRTIGGPVSDYGESMALSHAPDAIDIYSCSWGPYDDGQDMQGPGHLTKAVLKSMVGDKRGRKGRGSIYVWASGNGQGNQDSCAYDGYAGSEYVLAIGAVNYMGQRSWYSEGCSNLFAVAPSSGAGRGITTADLEGSDGYEYGECTNSFGGTSSATPAAAGVIARILERYPTFTARDIKHIIAKGATPLQADNECKNKRIGTPCHSNAFGFGLLRIPELMRTAGDHTSVPPEKTFLSGTVSHHANWRFGQSKLSMDVPMDRCSLVFIEHVVLDISIRHPHRGDVVVSLFSPSGKESVLAPQHPDSHRNYPRGGWSFASVHFWGETHCKGTWKVVVYDAGRSARAGQVDWIKLSIKGF